MKKLGASNSATLARRAICIDMNSVQIATESIKTILSYRDNNQNSSDKP